MKKILLILFVIGSLAVDAQRYQQNNDLSDQIRGINLQLKNFHDEYQKGTHTIIVGAIISSIGILVLIPDSKAIEDRKPATIVALAGCAISLIGVVIQIDSHKHVNRTELKDFHL